MAQRNSQAPTASETVNSGTLVGRVSAAPEGRGLPSEDASVPFRLIAARPPGRKHADSAQRPKVAVIDIACWSARSRRAALRLEPDTVVQVQGALRRRFSRTGGGAASRY